MNTPPDYNHHIHGHCPRTRVERLAWLHRYSTSDDIRQAAAIVLVMAGCLKFHPLCVVQVGKMPPICIRTNRAAIAARKLRSLLSAYEPRNTERGVSTWLSREVDELSARVEAQGEGRAMPRGRPDFHG